MRKRDNAAIGKKSKNVGDRFEQWIESQHELAKQHGIVYSVVHNQPTTKFIRGRLIYTSAGASDYTGVLAGGRAFAVEAKSTDKERLPRASVKLKQAEQLDSVARAGGLALLLVEFRHVSVPAFPVPDIINARFAIPWLEVPWKVLRSAESVGSYDLSDWEIHSDCYLYRFCESGTNIAPTMGRRYRTE